MTPSYCVSLTVIAMALYCSWTGGGRPNCLGLVAATMEPLTSRLLALILVLVWRFSFSFVFGCLLDLQQYIRKKVTKSKSRSNPAPIAATSIMVGWSNSGWLPGLGVAVVLVPPGGWLPGLGVAVVLVPPGGWLLGLGVPPGVIVLSCVVIILVKVLGVAGEGCEDMVGVRECSFADERVVYNEVVDFRVVVINGEDDEVDIGEDDEVDIGKDDEVDIGEDDAVDIGEDS